MMQKENKPFEINDKEVKISGNDEKEIMNRKETKTKSRSTKIPVEGSP